MSKAHRKVVKQNDELKQRLLKKEEVVGKIINYQEKIKELQKKIEDLLPKKERLEKKIKEIASKEDIKTKEGESVSSVLVENGKVVYQVTNTAEYLKEATQSQVDKLWKQYEAEIKKLSETNGDK